MHCQGPVVWPRTPRGPYAEGRMKRVAMTATVAAALVLVASAPALAQHSGLKWNGPGTCVQCHYNEAMQVHASAHYQWEGASPYQADGPALQGKKQSAVNSYCVNILGNWGGCGSCHVGLGKPPVGHRVADARRSQQHRLPDLPSGEVQACEERAGPVRRRHGAHDHHDGPGRADGARARRAPRACNATRRAVAVTRTSAATSRSRTARRGIGRSTSTWR